MVPRLAGLGAFAVSTGIAFLFVLFVWFTRPTATGGMTWTLAWLGWLSVGGVVLALIAVHVVYGRILLETARYPEGTRMPL